MVMEGHMRDVGVKLLYVSFVVKQSWKVTCFDHDLRYNFSAQGYEQRNMADKNSTCAALTSNVPKRDRAKDVEQLGDILRR